MKFPTAKRNNRLTKEGVRPGFEDADIAYLNRQTDTPKTIIWSYEELEEQEPEDRSYYCAECKSKLDYLKGSETVWQCGNCMSYYDTRIQDTVLKDVKKFKVKARSSMQHYPTHDADDPEIPFVEGIDLNRAEELENRSFEDKRVQTINLHNITFADAIRAGALTAKKREDDY